MNVLLFTLEVAAIGVVCVLLMLATARLNGWRALAERYGCGGDASALRIRVFVRPLILIEPRYGVRVNLSSGAQVTVAPGLDGSIQIRLHFPFSVGHRAVKLPNADLCVSFSAEDAQLELHYGDGLPTLAFRGSDALAVAGALGLAGDTSLTKARLSSLEDV